jgi:hypothetical protein
MPSQAVDAIQSTEKEMGGRQGWNRGIDRVRMDADQKIPLHCRALMWVGSICDARPNADKSHTQ